MARQTSFGEALAHARERKGLDLSTAARKLRIRPDILRHPVAHRQRDPLDPADGLHRKLFLLRQSLVIHIL